MTSHRLVNSRAPLESSGGRSAALCSLAGTPALARNRASLARSSNNDNQPGRDAQRKAHGLLLPTTGDHAKLVISDWGLVMLRALHQEPDSRAEKPVDIKSCGGR
ncbi:predicted protein [Uncinocarpus reesii 1704]|uniref:Uncharacterized protein n=1 Tax=Uncinocarpus reesii (strain UAMH 1704) TaxID=336963 RepID=C4JUW5_UNCRE|nr:uncharacterized protein UREG_04918 [Uncinocarpus reesii 1704]EEP80076.1 predicted protein [Uncinocarpus reesii 1704]